MWRLKLLQHSVKTVTADTADSDAAGKKGSEKDYKWEVFLSIHK